MSWRVLWAAVHLRATFGRSERREALCSVGIVARRYDRTPKNAPDVARISRFRPASGMIPCLNPRVAPIHLVGVTLTTAMAVHLVPRVTTGLPAAGVAAPVTIVTAVPVAPTDRRVTTTTTSQTVAPAVHAARARLADRLADRLAPPRAAGATTTSAARVAPHAMTPRVARVRSRTTGVGVEIGLHAMPSRSLPATPKIHSPSRRIPMIRWPFPPILTKASKRLPTPMTASRRRPIGVSATAAIPAIAAIPHRAGGRRTPTRAAMTMLTALTAVALGAIAAPGLGVAIRVIRVIHACPTRWTILARPAPCATAIHAILVALHAIPIAPEAATLV